MFCESSRLTYAFRCYLSHCLAKSDAYLFSYAKQIYSKPIKECHSGLEEEYLGLFLDSSSVKHSQRGKKRPYKI